MYFHGAKSKLFTKHINEAVTNLVLIISKRVNIETEEGTETRNYNLKYDFSHLTQLNYYLFGSYKI